MLFFKRIICLLKHHVPVDHKQRNKIIKYRCARCFKKMKTPKEDYNIVCEVSGKRMHLPLIQENKLTVWVGIDKRIIKRHKLKHMVQFV